MKSENSCSAFVFSSSKIFKKRESLKYNELIIIPLIFKILSIIPSAAFCLSDVFLKFGVSTDIEKDNAMDNNEDADVYNIEKQRAKALAFKEKRSAAAAKKRKQPTSASSSTK